MLNRQFVIREFITYKLPGVIDWSRHVTPCRDGEGHDIVTGDHAAVDILTRKNKYRLDAWSSYGRPAHAIPGTLGYVELKHDGEIISGDVSDFTWMKIANYIKEQEGPPEVATPSAAPLAPAAPLAANAVLPADRAPYVGMPALYRGVSGMWRGGMEHAPAFVMTLWDDNRVDLCVVSGGEISFPQRVPFCDGVGDFHSWKFLNDPEIVKLRAEIAELRDLLEGLTAQPKAKRKQSSEEALV